LGELYKSALILIMFKKITIILTLLFTVFISSPVLAVTDNTSNIPETNPFCWKKIDCQKARKNLGTSDDKSGFITGASVAPCFGGTGDEEWGRCLPAGTSKTEISFGGKSEFNNIGDFILVMYKYMLTIASIVAVVVIIIAGAQWITSGGNSEAIGSAKKRIGGAVIGLFIAYMSYFILNTINPALVNLRLPQVWLIKPISLTPEFCSELEPTSTGKIKFMHAAGASEQADGKAKGFNLKLTDKNIFNCGERFFGEAAGKTPCMGNLCPMPGKTCFDEVGKRQNFTCGDVRIGGDLTTSVVIESCSHLFLGGIIEATGASSPWDCPPISDSWLMPVCNNQITDIAWETSSYAGGGKKVGDLLNDLDFGSGHGETKKERRYRIEEPISTFESDGIRRCDKFGGIKGFVVNFKFEFSNSVGDMQILVGKGGVDLGRAVIALRHLHKLKPQFMYSVDEVRNGGRLNVDAANIEKSEIQLTDKQKSYYDL
jgi:hypothetical protein